MIRIFIPDNSVTNGAGISGLTSASTNLTIDYMRELDSAVTTYTGANIEAQTTIGTYQAPSSSAKIRFKETPIAGLYELHFHDSATAFGSADVSQNIVINIREATTTALKIGPNAVLVTLVPWDYQDGVRMGLTSLPNAAAEAAGGLLTRGTGAGQINQDANGRIDANVKTWIGGAIPAVNITGVPKVDIVDWLGTAPNSLSAGRVDSIPIVRSNTATAGTSTTLTFDAGASAIDNFYMGSGIIWTSGANLGVVRVVSNYVGSTKVATFAVALPTTADATPTFTVTAIRHVIPGSDGKVMISTDAQTGVILPRVTLVDTLTTYTSNTPQTGDSFARIGANGAGLTAVTGVTLAASQHVIVDSGTVTNLTNLPTIPANWLTAVGISAAALNGKGDWATVNPTNLTAAQIATGVWQDTTSGDFTTASSVGKSLMNGIALGNGLTIVSVSGSVGSVTGNVGGSVASVATGGIVSASFAAGAIDSAAIATDAIGSAELASSAVTKIQSGLALAATALSTATWTATRAGYIDNLSAGAVALESSVTAIQNNTRNSTTVPEVIERPDSGTTTYRIEIFLYDEVGNMEAPDSAPTIALVNQAGTDRSARLDSTTMALVSTGRYRGIYTADVQDALEQLVWVFTVVEGGATRLVGRTSIIVDTTAVDFTSSDRTKLVAVFDKLPSKTYLTGSNNSDGDVQLDEGTGAVATVTLVTTATNLTNLPAITANWLTAAGIATDAITDAKVAADVTIASVTGAVGSVTGNVGGSVASVTAAVTLPTIPTDWITANGIATDALGSLELSAGAASEIATAVAAVVPTASQIDTQLSGTHGAGSWLTGAGAGGSGAFTLTITVNDGAAVLQNATIRMTEGANTYTAVTNSSGIALFALDAATYSVAITKGGYSFATTTKVVSATGSQTYSMSIVSISPSTSSRTTCYLTVQNFSGVPVSGATVYIEYVNFTPSGSGEAVSVPHAIGTTDAAGLVQFVNSHRLARVRVKVGSDGPWRETLTADAATTPLLNAMGEIQI